MDRPDPRELRQERAERTCCSTVCSQEAQDLMRRSPQARPDARPGDYPPSMTLQDRGQDVSQQRDIGAPRDNAALQQQTAVLFNPNASAEQKLACVQKLADSGLNELAYRDQAGEHKLRLEKIPVGSGDRNMVHLFGTDENGQQRTILRGIAHSDGSFEQEKNQQGQSVDYYGMGKGLLDRPPPADICPAGQRPDTQYRVPGQDSQYRLPPYQDSQYGPQYGNPTDGQQYAPPDAGPIRRNPFHRYPDQQNQLDCPSPYPDNGYRPGPGPDSGYRPGPRPDNGGYRPSPRPNDGYGPNDGYRPYDPSMDRTQPNPYRRPPSEREPLNDRPPVPYNGDKTNSVFRSPADRNNFYAHQNDGYSCSAFSMAMMASDWNTGHPPSNAESSNWKRIAGTIGQGYRGSLNQVASNLQEGIPGLHTKVYNYGMGRVGQNAMQDLNRELDQGHTAVAKVINPHTGNAHYIYIAGRTQNGEYILGDPDRKNPHQQPISGARLQHMMQPRDGFVVGWKDSPGAAARVPGSAAYRYAMAHQQRYE